MVDRLGADPVAAASRLSLCETISQTLGRLGRLLWVVGDIIGNDRKTGASPFGFGDDRTVGVATVAQIGGALSDAVVSLLKAGNLYAASALIRQLVEVEYLAHAFANDMKWRPVGSVRIAKHVLPSGPLVLCVNVLEVISWPRTIGAIAIWAGTRQPRE